MSIKPSLDPASVPSQDALLADYRLTADEILLTPACQISRHAELGERLLRIHGQMKQTTINRIFGTRPPVE